jgi:hypothetical protein
VCAWLKWTWSAAEAELDFPRWASLCRQRDICPPVDVLVAGYLGWERPVREIPIKIDREQEDADFAAAMRDFSSSKKTTFNVSDLSGDR